MIPNAPYFYALQLTMCKLLFPILEAEADKEAGSGNFKFSLVLGLFIACALHNLVGFLIAECAASRARFYTERDRFICDCTTEFHHCGVAVENFCAVIELRGIILVQLHHLFRFYDNCIVGRNHMEVAGNFQMINGVDGERYTQTHTC